MIQLTLWCSTAVALKQLLEGRHYLLRKMQLMLALRHIAFSVVFVN